MTESAMRRVKRARLTARSSGRPTASHAPVSAVQRSVTGRPAERRAHTSSSAAETSISMAIYQSSSNANRSVGERGFKY
uniref:Uncharacterized protein n=1 Tax=Arundo donax TaxID=35708 RepID=A0A0A9BKZ1_ARUDO